MIARLRGRMWGTVGDAVVIDVGGVGYRVVIPRRSGQWLPAEGDEVALFVHTHVREDAIVLYGFQRAEELALFETLIGIGGVGPRLALGVLSALTPEQVRQAVARGDVAMLRRVPGIGKKTAERLLFDLRDRWGGPGVRSAQERDGALSTPAAEAREALIELGYSEAEADEALERVYADGVQGTEDAPSLVQAALRYLAKVR
ncbi:MAG TPA: Holliday junction branch migration protein RuvA [Limnochordia bacterium]